MNRRLRLVFASAWLALAAPAALAAFDPVNDDTDIFLANPSFASTRPNVLIFVDNTANWGQTAGTGTKYDGVRAALTAVLANTVTDAYNVGFAMFVETGAPNNSTDGAYIRYGVRQMTGTAADATTNKGRLIAMINGLDRTGDQGNNATFSLAMSEMFNYFAGRPSYSGHGKNKSDADETVFMTGATPTRQAQAASPLAAGALPANGGSAQTYVSPIVDGCQKNFIILISNGEASDNAASLLEATALYQAQTSTSPTTISLSPGGEEGILTDEYAKYMANADCNQSIPGVQNVLTYTIDVLPKSIGQGPDHTSLLRSTAANGKGKYFAITDMSNTSQIETALTTIFQEVQSVNSVFASTTLPVSVNVRGTNLNQVYIGVFRPDSSKSPRWLGNLKLYKLGVNTATEPATLFLADRTGAQAENASTGFISATASSFWNERNNVGFWKFRDASLNGPGGDFEIPDGDLVEKGGVAQQMRANNATSQAARQVYTCVGAEPDGLCSPGALLADSPFTGGDSPTIVAAADVRAYNTVAISALSAVADTSPATSATVTADTAAAHGLSSGNTVRIEGASPAVYNGDFSVVSTVASSVQTVTALLQVLGVATATAASHGFSTGQQVTITGADQSGYNVTASITVLDSNSFTYPVDATLASPATTATSIRATRSPRFTYSVDPAPAANRARVVTSGSHGLTSGNLVVIDTSPDAYDTISAGSAATIVNATTFEYTTGAISGSHAGPVVTAKGRKSVTALNGSSTTASASVPLHGYGTIGSTVAGVTITGANETAFNTQSPVTVTITSLDSFSYTTPSTITGTANTAQAKVTGHTFAAGGYVHIVGNSVSGYNTITGTTVGTPLTLSSVAGAFFTFPSSITSAGTGGAAGLAITNIAYGTGASQNVATVTTATPHGFLTSPATTVKFFNTGGTYVTGPTCSGYNNATNTQTFTVQSTPSATTFTINADKACPKGATGASGAVPNGSIVGFDIDTAGASPGINPIVSATGTLYSEKNFTISSIAPLSSATGSMTAGNPDVGDATVRDAIVNWVRGQDNRENENNDCTGSPFYPCSALTSVGSTPRLTDIRASAHGDVLHSRPATINYSRFPSDPAEPASDNDIYVYYGSNDGMLHAIKGGVASEESGVRQGDERWAFIPKEFFGKLKRLRENSPAITNISQKDYFFDGSIGVYQKDVTPAGGRAGTVGDDPDDKVYLFVSLRRGGDFIYALDVTNPAKPTLLWRRGSKDKGWAELGQTWSEPKVTRLNWDFNPSGNPDRVALVFGAGYDKEVEDINACLMNEFNTDSIVTKAVGTGSVTYTSGGSCTISDPTGSDGVAKRLRGRGILVVDAVTGDVLWQVGAKPSGATTVDLIHPDMTCSISSDISVLDRNRDGFADRLYVGDTCGNVWRAEISSKDPTDWTVTRIAVLSTEKNTDIAGKRKFQFPPDLVLAKDDVSVFFAVLIGAGDREHPFDSNVQNTFFMVIDRDAFSPEGAANSSTLSFNKGADGGLPAPTTYDDLFDATSVSGVNKFGWKINLLPGEKSVGSAVTVAGTTFFNTNQPSATAGGGACGSNLGIARQYQVSFTDAAATTDLNGLGSLSIANRSTIHAGGGYLPSPVPVVVEIDGKKYQAVISGTSVQTPPGLTLDARLRTYWYKEIDQ